VQADSLANAQQPNDTTGFDLIHEGSSIKPTKVFVQHSNPNIQPDMELWNRIREYDQKAKEDPFSSVLSKKQKQKLRQQQIIGKPPYRTRSRGDSSLNGQ
jgi:hypothetical protein